MPQRLVFTGKQAVEIEDFRPADPAEAQIRVRTLYTLMSTGTETTVFDRRFDPGTHWDRWVKYPFYPGYSTVGQVEAVGKNVTTFKVGDRVATRNAHASHHTLSAEMAWPVPASVDPREAVWFALGKIAFMGAKVAGYHLGASVLVIGAGPIGQMSLRWAVAAGCDPVFVVDTVPMRLEHARRGGAAAVFAQPADQLAPALTAANNGQLPEVVVDSTGNAQVFQAALALPRDYGRIILIGDPGSPASQHLSPDLLRRGLTIIGAFEKHVTAEFTQQRIIELFFRMVTTKRFDLSGLSTHTFEPKACREAYQLALTGRDKTMGILFDWTKSGA